MSVLEVVNKWAWKRAEIELILDTVASHDFIVLKVTLLLTSATRFMSEPHKM